MGAQRSIVEVNIHQTSFPSHQFIHVQAYINPESPIYAGSHIKDTVAATKRLLELAREKGVLVIHTGVLIPPGGETSIFCRKVSKIQV